MVNLFTENMDYLMDTYLTLYKIFKLRIVTALLSFEYIFMVVALTELWKEENGGRE